MIEINKGKDEILKERVYDAKLDIAKTEAYAEGYQDGIKFLARLALEFANGVRS